MTSLSLVKFFTYRKNDKNSDDISQSTEVPDINLCRLSLNSVDVIGIITKIKETNSRLMKGITRILTSCTKDEYLADEGYKMCSFSSICYSLFKKLNTARFKHSNIQNKGMEK
mmetsp:Transcript_60274/g.71688  ORF Transcript_60274/g.71688 Transcript_60274/m.71688 type:complete len:113 (+) Transcript_60274:79-417(+)